MKNLLRIFHVNVPLKLLSIAIAFCLWLTVVNVSNPEVQDTVTMEIAVNYGDELINAGKSFSLDTRTVRVSYRVRTNYRSQVQPSSFNAYVDMRDYSITGAVPVYVEVSDRVSGLISGVTQNPMVIHVSTEDMQEKSFPLTAKVNGSVADGHVAGDVIMEPAEAVLYGPESEIGQISRVGIILDISGAEEDQEGIGRVQFFDANDNVIALSDKVAVRNEIHYTVPVYKTKNLSINVPTRGLPSPGYTLTGVEMEPRFVSVYGTDEVLERYNTIYLPEGLLDITGAGSNVTISLDMEEYLPEGLYLTQPGTTLSVAAQITRQTGQLPSTPVLPPTQTVISPAGTDASESAETASPAEGTDTEHDSETEEPSSHESGNADEGGEGGSGSEHDASGASEAEHTTELSDASGPGASGHTSGASEDAVVSPGHTVEMQEDAADAAGAESAEHTESSGGADVVTSHAIHPADADNEAE